MSPARAVGGGSSVGVGSWGSDPGGVRVGNGAGGAGAVGGGVVGWPGGVQPGAGEPPGRGVVLAAAASAAGVADACPSSIPNS